MMKRSLQFLVVVVVAVQCSGCVVWKSFRETREIADTLRKDMIDYYENMAAAYYLLGFGFYQLSVEAEKNKLPEADQYRSMAALYKRYCEDLKESTTLLRDQLGVAESPASAALPEGDLSPVLPGPSDLEPEPPGVLPRATDPAIVPVAPIEEEPTLLERLRFWKKKH